MVVKKTTTIQSSCTSGVCIPSYVAMALSGLMGGFSAILFVIFLYTGLPGQMNLGLNEPTILFIDTLLSVLFFLQHSLMVRTGFRTWLSGLIPREYIGAIYSIFSGLFLLILMLFWQNSASIQFEFDGMLYWLIRALFFLGIIGFYITFRSLKPFDLFGIREIASHLKGKTPKGSTFKVRGMYRLVRHPLYFFCLLIIWSHVYVSTDRLLFNGLWTLWIIIGTFLEERDLIAAFGDEYRNYQRTVPMLIPYKWFPWMNKQQ